MIKYIHIMLVGVLSVFASVTLSAQTDAKINVKAIVRDADGQRVPGAVIRSEEDNISTVADSTGTFAMEVTYGASLLINAPGYEAKFVAASIELKEIVMTANSKIKVGYQSMDRNNLIGGVSYVNMPEIMEKNFITYTLDNMEAFAGGFHGNLWGMND